MQHENQLPAHRSPLTLAVHRDGKITFLFSRSSPSNAAATIAGRSSALRPHVHSYPSIGLRRPQTRRTGEDRSIRTWPEQDRSWRFIPAAMFGMSARVIGAFAGCGEIAFSGFLLAFMSWTFAQVLAGCAAYAQAMYPCVIDEDQARERTDSPEGARSEPIPLPLMRKDRSAAAAPVRVEHVARLETSRVDPPARAASIAALWRGLRSRIARQRASRLAIAELRSLDDRSLQDVGLLRCDLEHIAGHGDRCE